MENQLLRISLDEPQETSASTGKLIREWLFRFAVEHKEDIAPRLPLWLEAFGGMDAAILERLFGRALRTCKFFPKVSEILEPLASAEANAAPEAAEQAWERVLELRRTRWSPDAPGGFYGGAPKLSERVAQACRAAGLWRDFDSIADLHTWAKKRFVESFVAWGEREQDKFLLTDAETRRLLADADRPKVLPAPKASFKDLHKRGLEYAAITNLLTARKDAADSLPEVDAETRAEIETELTGYRERFAAALAKQQATAGNPPELQAVEVSA
jgi:hypothetical protein